jgi:hypothetical protein
VISSPFVEFEEELGTDEESGKDWSELEEEATIGIAFLWPAFPGPLFCLPRDDYFLCSRQGKSACRRGIEPVAKTKENVPKTPNTKQEKKTQMREELFHLSGMYLQDV